MNTRDAKILVVDDDESMLKVLTMSLELKGFQVKGVSSGKGALAAMQGDFFDLALVDYQLSGETGTQLMKKMHGIDPDLPVIILTAYGSVDIAVDALHRGAEDFVEKPYKTENLFHKIAQSLEKTKLTREVKGLRELVSKTYGFGNIIARSDKMKRVLRQVAQAADTDSCVMIQGESGTGKELIAKTLHVAGRRGKEPFVAVNCAAIPETLFESELFGYKKGTFTGALRDKKGLLDQAGGGTFFFDEITEMPLSIQVKLLRVIQENEFYPLGGREKVPLEARIIAASNRDLEKEVAEGRFREDLFYRVHVIPIVLPPLRERRECIPSLANHFLKEFASAMNKDIRKFSAEAMEKLMLHDWPGNIRELKNVVEYSVAMAEGGVVQPGMVLGRGPATKNEPRPLKEARANFEREYITELLEITSGNVSKAAKLAGKYRADFYDLMKRCGISAESFRK